MPLVLLVDCMLLQAVVCHHSLHCMNTCEFSWRLFSFLFFSLVCHSISSTFSLFYFHFKGLGGTDVISNACLLPHCLKVRDDYFLMKPDVLAQKKWILPVSCEIDKQYFHITLNGNIHSFPHTTKAILKFFFSCQMCSWTLNFD